MVFYPFVIWETSHFWAILGIYVMKDWISLIWQGHVWGHIEDTFKPSNFFLFRHFYSFEHILTEEYLIFIHTINITKNQMILVMSCFVVLKRRNWFELRIYSGTDWAQCAAAHVLGALASPKTKHSPPHLQNNGKNRPVLMFKLRTLWTIPIDHYRSTRSTPRTTRTSAKSRPSWPLSDQGRERRRTQAASRVNIWPPLTGRRDATVEQIHDS